MKLQIHAAGGIAIEERESFERLVRLGLTRFTTHVRETSLSLSDPNGPRSGVDKRCVLRVVLKGLPEVVVQETHQSAEQAIRFAVARAARSVARALGRRRERGATSGFVPRVESM